ncbi:MAG: hypothetical protein JRN11_06070 [Nitrososphaerota archaeon]|nr:hypothetical protein [Nitrososphaerota archaeon]MDG7026296.1 hypothetical protein [Nitrososphaerota archaeon]
MREGSDAPHEGEGKDDDLEGFRKELAEGAGESDKDNGQGVRPREAGKEGEKRDDAKCETAEVVKGQEKGEVDVGGAQAEAGPGKEDAKAIDGPDKGGDEGKEPKHQEKGSDKAPAEAGDTKGEDEVRDGRPEAGDKDPTAGGVSQRSEQPKPVQKSGVEIQAEPAKSPEIEPDGPSQTQPESYTRNDGQVLVIERAGPGHGREERAETPGLRRLQDQNEREEVPRVLEAVDYGKGTNVRVPMGDLEQAGYGPPDHSTIVQLGLRPIEGDEVEAVYARYNASDRRAEAYVGDIGGAKGSKYELVEAKGVDEDKMARDFERGKCEHLQNVRLEHEEGKMFLNVDGRQVELEGYKMSTSGSRLVLRGKLGGKDDCKLEFDGYRAAVKFGRDYPVEGMRMEGDELVVKYVQSKNEVHEHRQSLDHPDIGDRKLSLGQLDKPEALRLARLLDAPEGTDGVYTFAVDKRLQESVRSILEGAMEEGTRRYGVVKGEVGEGLISNLMNLAGWERIERHPFNEKRKVGATGNGTDHVFRDPDHKLSISESKYWGQIESALKRGEIQVGTYYDRQRKYQGEEIERGYVMAMDWNLNDDPIRIHVRRVRQVVNSNV